MFTSQIRQPSQSQTDAKSKDKPDPAPEQHKSQPPLENRHNPEEPVHQNPENNKIVELVVSDGMWEKYGISLVESGVVHVGELNKPHQPVPQGTNIPSRIIEASEEDSNQTSQKGIQESHQTVKNRGSLDTEPHRPIISMSQQPKTSSTGPSHSNKLNNSMPRPIFQGDVSPERNNGKMIEEDEDDEEGRLVVDLERSHVPVISLEKKKKQVEEEEKEPEVGLERSRIPTTSIGKKVRSISECEKYFSGNNTAEIIKNDMEFHGVRMLKSHSLIRNEISTVINPCLKSDGVSVEVKEYLKRKKEELLMVQIPPEHEIMPEVEKSNELVESTLKTKNATADLERVQERLSIISQEKLANNNAQNELVNTASILKESKRIVVPARLEELRQRRTQYMQLFVYIKENIIPNLPEKEKNETQQRIDKELRDKAMRADEYLKKDKENNTRELSNFLNEEMPELEPYMLHGKSIEEREKEINEKIQTLKTCKESEENLLKQGPADSAHTTQENIKTLVKNIDYLNSLKDEAHIWTPVPLVKVGKKLNKGTSLKNETISNNTMVIEFTKIDAPSKKAYSIKWQIDGQESKQNKAFRCNKATQLFNETRTVVFSDADMKALDTKKIKLDLYSPSPVGCLNSVLSSHLGSGTLSLQQFRSNNTIENNVELAPGIKLNYILRIKKELNKNVVESLTVESFTRFGPFTTNLNISTVFKRYKPADLNSIRISTPIRNNISLAVPKLDNDTLPSLNRSQMPEGVEFDHVLHPDNPEHINSFGVLKEMLKLLEEERMRLIKEMKKEELEKNKEKWEKALKKSIDIENRIASGDIDALSYIKIIKGELQRDYRIQKLYQSRGEHERLSFIQEKLRLMESELKECEAVVE